MNENNPHRPCPPPRPDAAKPEEAARSAGEAPPRPLHSIRIGNRTIPMPASRWVRIALGTVLVVAGFAGFLPILGFWMIPLGLLILSIDLPFVRRWRRRTAVWVERRFPGFWARLRRWTSPSHLRGDDKQP